MVALAIALARVPFYGDFLEAVQHDGKVWVSVRRICEMLGISYTTQYRKLRESNWACMLIMSTHDQSGRRQELVMIDLDSLPMWLVTIHPSKVAFETRDKLDAFQKEAKAVLAAWFLGDTRSLAELARENEVVQARVTAMNEQLTELRSECLAMTLMLREANGKLDMVLNPGHVARPVYMTTAAYHEEYEGRKVQNREAREIEKDLSRMSRHKGAPVGVATGPRGGHVKSFRFDVLHEWSILSNLADSIPPYGTGLKTQREFF